MSTVRLPSSSGAQKRVISVIRDDLLHPIAGSKLRKFDALWPQLLANGITDIVTCGGLQSAHTAAVAALAAENGMRAHLLTRGERPAVPTGHHLVAQMMGCVTYVTRSEYADREAMFEAHVARISNSLPDNAKVAVIPEGASDADALPGLVRMVRWLADSGALGPTQEQVIVVDSGTGTTAIGLAIGAALLGVPWRIVGVMLAGERGYYEDQGDALAAAFQEQFGCYLTAAALPLEWVERSQPRRFGKVLPGEIATCSGIARQHGILLDPVYSMAAWEVAADLSSPAGSVAMLHAGGSLGLHGLAQRFPDQF